MSSPLRSTDRELAHQSSRCRTDSYPTPLEMVDEDKELPPDPKARYFGRPPLAPFVKVRLDYEPEPTKLLRDLTGFIYQNEKFIEYTEGPKDLWESISKAVISTTTYEH